MKKLLTQGLALDALFIALIACFIGVQPVGAAQFSFIDSAAEFLGLQSPLPTSATTFGVTTAEVGGGDSATERSSRFINLMFSPLVNSWVNNQNASVVLGQPDFISSSAGAGLNQFSNPYGVAVDAATGKVFVDDANNNRVLRFTSAAALVNGSAAEASFGGTGATAANTMNAPIDVTIDTSGNLWVADNNNHRVLRFGGAAALASGSSADRVLGQTLFTTNAATNPPTASSMFNPAGVFADAGGRLWVADANNNRVIRFDAAATLANGAAASGVLGQSGFTTNGGPTTQTGMNLPYGVTVDSGGRLFVADFYNNRVLRFDAAATLANGAPANGVLGQTLFTTSTAPNPPTAGSMNNPAGVAVDSSGRLYVVDNVNNRVLIFNAAATKANGANADNVLGQPGFTTNTVIAASASSLNSSRHLFFDNPSQNLFVADTNNNRVLRFAPAGAPLPLPTLGVYPNTPVGLSDNITITPTVAPTGTTNINVSTNTYFIGELTADVATGVVRVTDARLAGIYLVTIKAFGPGGTATKTFTLTVTTPVTCNPVSFAAATNFGSGTTPAAVAVGDFNGDGKQDLAVANSGSANVSILLGDGAGSFSAATNLPDPGSGPSSVAVGDFNGDGRQDLAVATQVGNVSIFVGNGDGTFSGPFNFPAGSRPFSVAVGDFNGDGKQDLAVADATLNRVSILLGDGAGNFSGPINFGAGNFPVSVAVGDFNGDGKQDLAVVNNASANVSILLGDGAGNFSAATNFGTDFLPRSVAVGDFNGDGKQDLAVANAFSSVSILLGNGDGTFSGPFNFFAPNNPSSVAVGDFNGDGNQDLATANGFASVSILLGDGAGNFSYPDNFAADTGPRSVAVGDFNGDGKQELAVANGSSNNVSILVRDCALTPNTAPTITTAAFSPITRQQGTAAINSTVATVADNETGAGSLIVTATSVPAGITVTNIVNTNGTITANVAAACGATIGNNTVVLQVSDGALTATANLTVNVTANTAPTLGTYPNTGPISAGSGTTVTPSAAPSDNGLVATLTATAPGFTGSLSGNPSTGVITVSNAGPAGNYTVTVTATDNCGAAATRTFTLTVNTPPAITAGGPLTRQQGSAGTVSTIATVSDNESSAGSLTVTATTVPAGITVTNIVNTNGTITANVAASCSATAGNNTVVLQVSDGSLTSTANLTVNVTANTAPVLTYNNPSAIVFGSGTTVNPATGPSDNGNVSTIVVRSTGTYTGTISVNNGTGVVSVSNAMPVGSHTITIRATDNCGATTDATFQLTVNKANTATTITSDSPDPSVFGGTVAVNFTVTATLPGTGTPTGNVVVTVSGGPETCTGTVASGICNINLVVLGARTLTATYVGDTNFNGSVGTTPHQVNIAGSTTVITSDNPDPSVSGQPVVVTFTVAAAAPGAGTPTGTVGVTASGGPETCTATLAAGSGSCTITLIAPGARTLTATYSGDANFTGSSGTAPHLVNKADTTTTLTSSVNPSVWGQSVTFTATVSVTAPGAGSPTGNVTFKDGATTICAAQTVAANVATCTISTLSTSSHPITAIYNGDGNFNASPASNTVNQVVNKADTTTSMASSLNTSIFGQSVTFTATVAAVLPGAGTPTGTVTFNIDGNAYCPNTPLNGSSQATCTLAGLPALPAGTRVVVAQYSGDANFNPSAGSVTPPQVVTKASTTTTITNSLTTATTVGQAYAVNWSVTVNSPGAGTPTGTVTVSDGTGATCTAAVAAGTCLLTSTTAGNKTVTATYNGDANFNGSTSTGVPHTVNIAISGTIGQFVQGGPNTPLAGVLVTLTGTNGGTTTTDANGNYSFAGVYSGNYTVTPSMAGKAFDPTSRTYANVTNNITGADFTAFNSPGGVPRDLRVVNGYTTPGQPVVVPIVLTSLGNEASITFSLNYDTNVSNTPTVTCGSSASGCTVTTDTSIPGRVGITIVPATQLAAGQREIAKVTFQTLATNLSNAPITFGDSPRARSIRDASNNPLSSTYTNGFIVFTQGIEGDVAPRPTGDVAPRPTGDGQLLANDVVIERQLVVSSQIPDPSYNEFQRADTAPSATMGDGQLDATDIVQVRRYIAGLDPVQAAGGPFVAGGGLVARPEGASASSRTMRVVSTNASPGSHVTVAIDLDSRGDEVAASFTLNFDQRKLRNPAVTLGTGAPVGTDLTTNTKDAGEGHVTVLVDSSNAFAGSTEPIQVITVTFDVAEDATGGATRLNFGNDPTPSSISNADGRSLATNYQNGEVMIAGTSAVGVKVSGSVITPDGNGLRNAQVTITDSNGVKRTVITSAFGYYTFEDIAAGEIYTISVTSKRYRFAPRRLQILDNLTDVDFSGQE